MRAVLAAFALLAACSGGARAGCYYDLYIYDPASGEPDVYAVAGEGRAAAVEVRGCGDASLLPDAAAVVARLQEGRSAPDADVVTIVGRGSRTILGGCHDEDHDDDEHADDDGDNFVIVEDASAAQMRRTLLSLDAAPRQVREQMIDTLALRTCAAER